MFTKPIDAITFEDIEVFCRANPEGNRVEYKSQIDVRKHIPKTVSAFANNLGGILLIGIEADQTKNSVIFPIKGTSLTHDFVTQIQQSCLDGIYPVLDPEVAVIDVPDSENVVVVVRVDASSQTPHSIDKKRKIYIRTGSMSKPYEFADRDQIESLFKRGEKSQQVVAETLRRIEERVESVGFAQDRPNITVIARPLFPDSPIISTASLSDLDLWFNEPKKVPGGIYSILIDAIEYTEVNEYGIAYHRGDLRCSNDLNIELTQYLISVTDFMERASRLYAACEYLGDIEVSVALDGVLHKILTIPHPTQRYPRGSVYCSQPDFSDSMRCSTRDLHNEKEKKNILEYFTSKLLWAFGISPDATGIRRIVGELIEGYVKY